MAIVKDEDLPVQMKLRQKMAHNIAEFSFEQIWNIAAQVSESINKQVSGNEALSYLATILSDFAARWIVHMNKIAQTDTAGITKEELIKDVLNGILACLGCEATFDDESKDLPHGIKRLKK